MMKNTLTVKNSLGHQITIFEDDYIGNKIIRKGLYERALLRYIDRLLSNMRQPVVLDVGANIGNHTLSFSRYANQVHAFEPVPSIFSVLKKNVEQNNLSNVHCYDIALSDESGTAEFFIINENVGASSFDKRAEARDVLVVKKQKGDDFPAIANLRQLDLIKMDVEGHELFALRGLEKTIRKFLPIVVMEWNDAISIERINSSGILSTLFGDYQVFVLGNNYDPGFWEGKKLGALRRKLTRWLVPKRARLYSFDPSRRYNNILLVPKTRVCLLPAQ